MDEFNLYDFLLEARRREERFVVSFDDGDAYLLSKIDFCFSVNRDGEREDEPLKVEFADCLNESASQRKAQAFKETPLAGIWWTSTPPVSPVAMSYEIKNVISVWDDARDYFVFER